MSPFGIVSVLCLLLSIGLTVALCFTKKFRRYLYIGLGIAYVGFVVCAILWAGKLYEGGNLPLAYSTFAVGGLLVGSLLLAPLLKPYKVATWIDMTAFLLLAIALIVLAVFLSKTVFQPDAPLIPEHSSLISYI